MTPRRAIDGSKVRDRREALGLSLSELAAKAGTHKGHVSEIENGRNVPSVALALDMAAALATSVEALFGEGPQPPAKPELVEALSIERAARAAHRILDGALRRQARRDENDPHRCPACGGCRVSIYCCFTTCDCGWTPKGAEGVVGPEPHPQEEE